MLKKRYFNDSFVLHDDSIHEMHLKTFFNFFEKESLKKDTEQTENIYRNLKYFESINKIDIRSSLHKKWASFSNIFRYHLTVIYSYLFVFSVFFSQIYITDINLCGILEIILENQMLSISLGLEFLLVFYGYRV
jgi:hypothetical protein